MKLRELSLKDRDIFSKYLGLCEHELSVYSFANIYIWKGLFEIKWALVQDIKSFPDRRGVRRRRKG